MCACDRVKIKNRSVCTGDLRHRIKIQRRTQVAPDFNAVDYEERFEDLYTYYAAIETNRGFESFNNVGTNTEGGSAGFTHKFYIRYSQSCMPTSENWVEYDCEKYKIIDVENLDERNRYVLLRCVKRGEKSLQGNLA